MTAQEFQFVEEPLADALLLAGRGLVCLVGAGGKTSLMFRLAAHLRYSGQRVITTTTTRIIRPPGEVVLEADEERLMDLLADRPLPGEELTLAQGQEPSPGGPKLVGLEPGVVDRIFDESRAEFILVEADGSKRRPIKAPRAKEPVIPDRATTLVGMIGLSCFGRPVGPENVFGYDEYLAITGTAEGELIGPDQAARLIVHPEGLFKAAPQEAERILFLNQADLPGARQAGLELIQAVAKANRGSGLGMRVVLSSLLTGQLEVYDPS